MISRCYKGRQRAVYRFIDNGITHRGRKEDKRNKRGYKGLQRNSNTCFFKIGEAGSSFLLAGGEKSSERASERASDGRTLQ